MLSRFVLSLVQGSCSRPIRIISLEYIVYLNQHYPIKVPGYFSCLHVLWDWMGADFLFSKELLDQLIVNISVWSDRPTAGITSIHIQIIWLSEFKLKSTLIFLNLCNSL